MDQKNILIVTAASQAFGRSLLALLGSLTLNWPRHPPVLVYDIGLDDSTRTILAAHSVAVKRVPAFCPHWRRHFTWKIWCWNDAPAQDILWLDAGLVVLQPFDEVFEAVAQRGYFVVPTGDRLMNSASVAMCRGCGLDPSFRESRVTLAGGIVGLRKQGIIQRVLDEALDVASTEEHMAATEPLHRHDQALLSLLLHKHLGKVKSADPAEYLASKSPRESARQRIWIHRRTISARDAAHFARHMTVPGESYLPAPCTSWRTLLPLYRVRRWFGRYSRRVLYDGVRD